MDKIANLGRWTQSKFINGALKTSGFKKILDESELKQNKNLPSVLIPE